MGKKTDKKNKSKCRGGGVEFNVMCVFCDLLLLLLLMLFCYFSDTTADAAVDDDTA